MKNTTSTFQNEMQAVWRFIPTTKSSRKAASLGYDHNESGLLSVKTLKPGEQHDVRFLPSFVSYDSTALVHPLVHHVWPPFEHNQLRVMAACPEKSDRELLETSQKIPCPACAAEVDFRRAQIVFALVDDQPMCLKFTAKNLPVLKRLVEAECFDLERGRLVRLWNDDWQLDFKLLQVHPISPKIFERVREADLLHTRTWSFRPDLLTQMAQACEGWKKAGEVEPHPGQHARLIDLLPRCTLIRIPWGMKGPQDSAWQNTSFGLMSSAEYQMNLDQGNIGLLCGRDPVAVEAGLIPDVVVVGLDADEDVFAESLRLLNPWLDDTFAVEGARGLKWFFAIKGEGVERCLRSTKIMQRGADRDREVGDWLASGKQGVVWGLHPSGKMYKPNWKPLLTIDINGFRLPRSFYLPSQQVNLPTPAEQFRKAGHRFGKATAGAILDLGKLVNVHRAGKGTGAACPACQAEGKDTAGDNLLIYPTGQFKCARFIGCTPDENHEHNQEIYRLACNGESTDEN